jgi:hypothetical protein
MSHCGYKFPWLVMESGKFNALADQPGEIVEEYVGRQWRNKWGDSGGISGETVEE